MTDTHEITVQTHTPTCRHARTVVTLTVTAFRWERQFLQCADCGRAFSEQWRDTYVDPASERR